MDENFKENRFLRGFNDAENKYFKNQVKLYFSSCYSGKIIN